MKRAKQLGSVVFENNSLFVKEEFVPNNIIEETVKSAAMTDIVYIATDLNPNVTLESQSNGWVTENQRSALISMWINADQTYTLTYSDDSTETVRFRHGKNNAPVFNPTHEGSELFTAEIYLSVVT